MNNVGGGRQDLAKFVAWMPVELGHESCCVLFVNTSWFTPSFASCYL